MHARSYRGSPEAASGSWKSQQNYFGIRFPGIKKTNTRSVLSIRSAPPKLGHCHNNHQVLRRHMQRKENEKQKSQKLIDEDVGNTPPKASRLVILFHTTKVSLFTCCRAMTKYMTQVTSFK